ncbi:MAG TPA: SIS domain-containing protein [Candidatus Udaeobacter sp.]|jgi:D-sedoheptulose 7-phosphate isomerase|nr:SIS domain-containing protein [Candidatus Udaeobacter sp.]
MKDSVLSEVKLIATNYLQTFELLLHQIDMNALERIVQHLRNARDSGATIYVAGNGGSAATASHWANDLGKATKAAGRAPMRVMSLSDNISWLTALANDEGYERVFSGQLENFARAGDVLIVISASGNSPNLIRAVELARRLGVVTIGFLGFDGGALKNRVDEYLWLHTEKGAYGLVESGHALICHILTDCLALERVETRVNSKDDEHTYARRVID